MKEILLSHEYFMRRCLQLAENGRQAAMPNPSVGAVIVYKDNIIGEGYTAAFGGAHGEVNAIQSVHPSDVAYLSESTLYVSLEPCSHFGKTPPCSDLIIRYQIPHVVIGTLDPNPLVAGNGIKKLTDAGIKTTIGILEDACKWSLRKFLIPVYQKKPFVTLKWAESRNQKIAQQDGTPVRITSSSTQILTHRLRSEHQGILCGWKTVKHDNPHLDNRLWTGTPPQVIVIDVYQKLNDNIYFQSKNDWWRIVSGSSDRANDIILTEIDLPNILEALYQKGIHSLFVEGGGYTHQQFIDTGLWDECYIYKGAIDIPQGIHAPTLSKSTLVECYFIDGDQIQVFSPESIS